MVIRGMSFVHRLAVCLACLVVFVPRSVPALELGPIEARSALYEPLDARIPIQGARSGDLNGLNVVLGSPAQFELAGVARLQHLNLLEFVVVEQDGGGGYIQVRTDEPIIEPSLTFLIDVDWPRGRTVRGYRLHLASDGGRETGADRSTSAAPQAQPASDTGTSDATPARIGMEYGPVREAETLWSIAARLRPDKSVSVQRMMLAILEANPNAFEFGNVNALNAGTTLRIPTRDDIGPDNLNAAVAEVQRHHSAWTRYRKEGRAVPAPSAPAPEAPAPEAPPRHSETEPGGRIEVVAPESTTTPGREEGARVATLRKELALAMEEADAGRRQNDELKLRLAEAEDHIKELNRLVELKNEEIAALRSELHDLARTAPQAVAEPEEAEPKPAAAPEGEAKPVLEPEEAESKPVTAPAAEEVKPILAPAETEPIPVPAPAEAEPKPATTAAEPKSLPFGLGSLPVNPVFLVGGAGLLLILLGVMALLRRRRASAGEDEVGEDEIGEELVLDAAESSPPGEDNLLLELEAVAAELADEPDDSKARPARAALVAAADAGMKPEAEARGETDSVPEDIVEKRIAQLWQDDQAAERHLVEEIEADDDSSEPTFDIDALTADDTDLQSEDDDAGGEPDIGDLADLADLAAERETEADRPTGEAPGNLDLLFSRHEAQAADSGTPATDAGDLTEFDPTMLDEEPDDALPAARDHRISRDSEVDSVGTPAGDVDVESAATADRSVDDVAIPDDDAGGPGQALDVLLDESTDNGESEALSLDEFGEDEVQTKIDLAQVYMEMGDTESARGFLEAVLAEGDAEQQEAAREMLSKLG